MVELGGFICLSLDPIEHQLAKRFSVDHQHLLSSLIEHLNLDAGKDQHGGHLCQIVELEQMLQNYLIIISMHIQVKLNIVPPMSRNEYERETNLAEKAAAEVSMLQLQ